MGQEEVSKQMLYKIHSALKESKPCIQVLAAAPSVVEIFLLFFMH